MVRRVLFGADAAEADVEGREAVSKLVEFHIYETYKQISKMAFKLPIGDSSQLVNFKLELVDRRKQRQFRCGCDPSTVQNGCRR